MTRCVRSQCEAIRLRRFRSGSASVSIRFTNGRRVCFVERQGSDEADEIKRLKKELAGVTEERDILNVNRTQAANRLPTIIELTSHSVAVKDTAWHPPMFGNGLHACARAVANLFEHFLPENRPQSKFHR